MPCLFFKTSKESGGFRTQYPPKLANLLQLVVVVVVLASLSGGAVRDFRARSKTSLLILEKPAIRPLLGRATTARCCNPLESKEQIEKTLFFDFCDARPPAQAAPDV